MTEEIETILIADDDGYLRKLLETTLDYNHRKVLTAADGPQAFELAKKHLPSVIILDVIMPKMDGIEVCKKVKATSGLSDAFVILLTGHDHTSIGEKANQAGADAYLTKPFSPLQLIRLVESRGITSRKPSNAEQDQAN
ncbi:response regulator [Ferriphaselus sp. R-1]|uniref:response regulator n=1 Tax=Ferriphaselus sp. R-1 TaxID=1485544 RepID=UPI00068FE3B4|nr:response regulator [Ferriphaselus sp. R-1]